MPIIIAPLSYARALPQPNRVTMPRATYGWGYAGWDRIGPRRAHTTLDTVGGTTRRAEIVTTTNFVVQNRSSATIEQTRAVAEQLEGHLVALTQRLPLEAPSPIQVRLIDGGFIPHAAPAPGGGMLMNIPVVDGNVAKDSLLHELIHVVSGFSNVGLMEGLAVHADQAIQPHNRGVFPAFGQSVDAWTKMFIDNGHYVPLSRVFAAKAFFTDAHARPNASEFSEGDVFSWQAYIEAASFVRWLLDNVGWEEFWRVYQEASLTGPNYAVIGPLLDAYEDVWKASLSQASIPVLPARDVLPVRDPKFAHLAALMDSE